MIKKWVGPSIKMGDPSPTPKVATSAQQKCKKSTKWVNIGEKTRPAKKMWMKCVKNVHRQSANNTSYFGIPGFLINSMDFYTQYKTKNRVSMKLSEHFGHRNSSLKSLFRLSMILSIFY